VLNTRADDLICAPRTHVRYATGATLSKCLHRALATLAAGFLAVGAHLVARLCGDGQEGEPAVLTVFVFLVGTSTHHRSIGNSQIHIYIALTYIDMHIYVCLI
jgi:hypothetical protein